MDKELDGNIKPVEPKKCCGADMKDYIPDPNCCRIVHDNTLGHGMSNKKWNALSHEEKFNYAINHNWRTYDGAYLREFQPKYDPNKQNFRPI